jgi:hypothetical protein
VRTLIVCAGLSLAELSVARAIEQQGRPEPVDICDLQHDPAGHDHQEIQVSGAVVHDFENFSLSDARCHSPSGVWLEYGGALNSQTMYCCGHAPGSPRGETLRVDGIALPLVDDALFRRFDDRNKSVSGRVTFGATLVGHFFAGKKKQRPDGLVYWDGYGHLGCCSLLVIQQVVDVRDADVSPGR